MSFYQAHHRSQRKDLVSLKTKLPIDRKEGLLSYWSAIAQMNDFSAAYSWRPSRTNTATERCKECKYFTDWRVRSWDLSQLTDVWKERKCVTFNLLVLHLPSMNSSVNWKSLHIRLEAASQQDEASATKNTASNQNLTLYEFVKKKLGGKFNLNVIICIWTPVFTPHFTAKRLPLWQFKEFQPPDLLFLFFSFYFWGVSWKKYENCLKDSAFL